MCFMTVYSLTVSLLLTDTVTGRSQLVGTPCLEHFAGGDNDVANALNNLKTWLFRKSYPDIVMWTFLIQTINLEVALLHRQTLIDWLIDWYICLTYMYFKCKQAKWNNFFCSDFEIFIIMARRVGLEHIWTTCCWQIDLKFLVATIWGWASANRLCIYVSVRTDSHQSIDMMCVSVNDIYCANELYWAERMETARMSQVKPARRKREPTSPVNDGSCCPCSSKILDESQLNSERLDDIAFDNHIMQSVYRKATTHGYVWVTAVMYNHMLHSLTTQQSPAVPIKAEDLLVSTSLYCMTPLRTNLFCWRVYFCNCNCNCNTILYTLHSYIYNTVHRCDQQTDKQTAGSAVHRRHLTGPR